MHNQIGVHPCNGTLFSHRKEWTGMDESYLHSTCSVEEHSLRRIHTVWPHLRLWKRQNYTDGKPVAAWGRGLKYPMWYFNGGYLPLCICQNTQFDSLKNKSKSIQIKLHYSIYGVSWHRMHDVTKNWTVLQIAMVCLHQNLCWNFIPSVAVLGGGA